MATPAPRAIILADGGLPSVVAAAIEAERTLSGGGGEASLMPWPTGAVLARSQDAAARSVMRFHRLGLIEPPHLCAADVETSSGLLGTLALLAAVEAARSTGATRVVWPVQFHADDSSLPDQLDRIGAAIDRALLVSRLALLDGGEEIAIETPLVDLTDRQLADLVVDLNAPAYLCWWWRRQSEPEAERLASAERRDWLAALREAGWVQSEARATAPTEPAPTTSPA